MNIVVFGAGAIGSLFAGLLSKNNKVVMVGRKDHVEAINKKSLKIRGLTKLNTKLLAVENVRNIPFSPDIVIISVKSYDTDKAMQSIKKIIKKDTIVISLQNGLDNIEKIQKYISKKQILICITTHGAVFSKPGFINHTGIGKTIVGATDHKNNKYAENVVKILDNAGIKTKISTDIVKDVWIKAVINSSINPLTAIFNCKNGYLLENPILEKIVEKVCEESTCIANACGYKMNYDEMIAKTRDVIKDTENNFSSMLQSIKQNKSTEIDAINGILVSSADIKKVNNTLNKILIHCVKSYF
jgi:2-dehydropantoate 2-reductase